MFKRVALLATLLVTQTASCSEAQSQSPQTRSDYREIEVAPFVQRYDLEDRNPREVARQLLERPVSLEGRQQETIAIEYPTGSDEIGAIEHTVIGLADDSVRSQRRRIEMKWQSEGWEIVWVGSQFQCRQGRGHQDWSSELCS
jgi:hypothetical protein